MHRRIDDDRLPLSTVDFFFFECVSWLNPCPVVILVLEATRQDGEVLEWGADDWPTEVRWSQRVAANASFSRACSWREKPKSTEALLARAKPAGVPGTDTGTW